jgi:hypothetical protein
MNMSEVMSKQGETVLRDVVVLRNIRGDDLLDVWLGGGTRFLDPELLHAGS